jgi:hypothetical protein
LIDIRNTVVADLKITNAEKVLALNTNKQHPESPLANTSHVPDPNPIQPPPPIED